MKATKPTFTEIPIEVYSSVPVPNIKGYQVYELDYRFMYYLRNNPEYYKHLEFKVISREDNPFKYYVVSTKEQPLMWVYWWIIFRLEKSWELFNYFIISLLETWEVIEEIGCAEPLSWDNVKLRKRSK